MSTAQRIIIPSEANTHWVIKLKGTFLHFSMPHIEVTCTRLITHICLRAHIYPCLHMKAICIMLVFIAAFHTRLCIRTHAYVINILFHTRKQKFVPCCLVISIIKSKLDIFYDIKKIIRSSYSRGIPRKRRLCIRAYIVCRKFLT